MMRFRFKEKYPRGRRGSPAKGVVREERSQGSNPCFSAKQNGQANSLVRFCFTTLNNRDLNESVKKTTRCVVNPGSQASVTIIRSLALNEIGTRDALSLIIFCLLSVSILA